MEASTMTTTISKDPPPPPSSTMSKENIFSTIRALLIFIGTFAVGHNLFGKPIDSATWQIILGSVMALGSLIWGMATKDTSIEGLESFLRSFIQGVGGLLVSSGMLTGDTLNAILGLVTALAPLLQSFASKTKTDQIVSGKIAPIISKEGVSTGMLTTQVPPKPDPNVVQEKKP